MTQGRSSTPPPPGQKNATPTNDGTVGSVQPTPGAGTLKLQPSFLDQLQKNAHKSELDYTNTKPLIFIALAMVQVPVGLVLAYLFGVHSMFSFLPIISHAIGFLVAVFITKSCKYFDMWGETTFFFLILVSHYSIACSSGTHQATPRQNLITALALIWCTRLGVFLGWRIFARGSDWRFDKLMHDPGYNFFGWVCQGTWIFLQGLCIWVLHANPTSSSSSFNAWDVLGTVIWAAGLVLEHVADQQKTRWNAQTPSGKQETWLHTGVWQYSRHPNFFGENLVWVGLGLITFGGVEAWTPRFVALISPVWSVFFLFFTSLMLLEKRLDAKFGGNPAYEKYKLETSVLICWMPRSCSGHLETAGKKEE